MPCTLTHHARQIGWKTLWVSVKVKGCGSILTGPRGYEHRWCIIYHPLWIMQCDFLSLLWPKSQPKPSFRPSYTQLKALVGSHSSDTTKRKSQMPTSAKKIYFKKDRKCTIIFNFWWCGLFYAFGCWNKYLTCQKQKQTLCSPQTGEQKYRQHAHYIQLAL